MKALTFCGKENIEFQEVADPKVTAPQDAIVKVKLTAICGSDLHVYHERETGLDHGTVMGHEFVGEVVELGKEVRNLKVGDMVTSPFTTSCGACFFCKKGLTARCVAGSLYGWVENGEGLHGGQAEYVRVALADSTLVKIPEGVTLTEALLLGDILCTGYFCADMAQISPEGAYAVLGCGPVGLLAILGARELGAQTIYAVDCVPERLAHAQRFGAIPINFQQQDVKEVILEKTQGIGVDAVLEVVGSNAAERTAVDIVRPGGIISVAGVHTANTFSFSPVEAYDKNLTYKIGRCSARYYMDKLIPVVQSKKYDLSSIISHRLPLADGKKAYEMFDKKCDNCTKVILENS
ncbi:alcohol dehydrogenase family protein [Candidatus Uabimicrobium amorphum]|uniref:Glutathione-dependent formaldehydedehydrogenase n=1 Tax=Uabimicrobium amorphum TaxID=2596890 RepID=A0A5S9IJH8_UABAM|nr:alcohol dehydrogenase family protein [Candidatus Uabimicrobium amorphum]BBM82854.1 glutathione-dependent formaldehydedehydrogenase [Candidatus Uabimicrobium amorphum]